MALNYLPADAIAEIRSRQIDWTLYAQLISPAEMKVMQQVEVSKVCIGDADIATLLSLISRFTAESCLQYLLVSIDDLLQADRSVVGRFHNGSSGLERGVYTALVGLLNRHDELIKHMAAHILAKLACWSSVRMNQFDLSCYMQFLKDQLSKACELHAKQLDALTQSKQLPKLRKLDSKQGRSKRRLTNPCALNEFALSTLAYERSFMTTKVCTQSLARCLQMMLRIDEHRMAFVNVNGISALVGILATRVNFQVQYQLIFCLWMLTYNPLLAKRMNKFSVIPILADIMSDSAKEKVSRVILACFRNLIQVPSECHIVREHCVAMAHNQVLKFLSLMAQRCYDDDDINADVEFLTEQLKTILRDMSSFDEYSTELRSGRLEWSPVHNSAQFWRENAHRLNEENYQLLRILIHLLETSQDPTILAVACYDVGEYARHYPHYQRGKHVIEHLGGKHIIMQHMSHTDPNVCYHALLALQKLLVHKWVYLGGSAPHTNPPQAAVKATASTNI